MDNLRRSARPADQPVAQPTPQAPTAEPQTVPSPRGGRVGTGRGRGVGGGLKGRLAIVLIGLVALALLIGGAWMLNQRINPGLVDGDKYQAVFLTNGQVYFGKIENPNADYVRLTNIFYLQATDAGSNPQQTEEGATEPTNDVQLIKLGTEVHGPTDEMLIAREQVLFFENLKDDGNVSQSIKSYYEANN